LVLTDLGETIDVTAEPQIGEYLEELLQAAIDGETYEFTEMYPPMIELATKDNLTDAIRTFTYAKKAEERHANLYTETLELLKAGKGDEIAKIWYVCPICGNLFNTLEGYEMCAICGAKKDTFTPFEK
jgi:rubrerythrin